MKLIINAMAGMASVEKYKILMILFSLLFSFLICSIQVKFGIINEQQMNGSLRSNERKKPHIRHSIYAL